MRRSSRWLTTVARTRPILAAERVANGHGARSRRIDVNGRTGWCRTLTDAAARRASTFDMHARAHGGDRLLDVIVNCPDEFRRRARTRSFNSVACVARANASHVERHAPRRARIACKEPVSRRVFPWRREMHASRRMDVCATIAIRSGGRAPHACVRVRMRRPARRPMAGCRCALQRERRRHGASWKMIPSVWRCPERTRLTPCRRFTR